MFMKLSINNNTICKKRIFKIAYVSTGKLLVLLLLLVIFFFSLSIGRYPISFSNIIGAFTSTSNVSETIKLIIFNLRFPRALAALIVGTSLAVSGAVYQSIFKNPMVSPSILGAQAGAGFGAALAILLSFSAGMVQLSSFLSGLLAVAMSIFIANLVKGFDKGLVLVLAGILTGTLFTSLISLLKFIADPYQKLPSITFWLMGSLSGIKTTDILFVLVPFIIGIVPVYIFRYNLNIMSVGDTQAKALGLSVDKVRLMFIISVSLLTSAAVSLSGLVGWIGLVIPHISRLLVGPDNRKMLPLSAVLGGIYLLLIDDIARCATSYEIPLGILTALIGCPFFVYLLLKNKG